MTVIQRIMFICSWLILYMRIYLSARGFCVSVSVFYSVLPRASGSWMKFVFTSFLASGVVVYVLAVDFVLYKRDNVCESNFHVNFDF